ncbi:MAG: two-component system, OmpR family, sensor kinase [Microbacteriaceae bacterium]|jgi:signal transduction histidine kinase|nr:two-component sensor histidine kinase [Microbacteriaceae bacterium]MDQ1528090.1 two-component system, OmpR family, sensor kinase [Microbacteriaceae bacterium]
MLARLTIRWRIALGSLLIAALFFGVAGITFRAQVGSILNRAATTLLANDAEQFESAIVGSNGDSVDQPGRGQLVAVIDPTGKTKVNTLPVSLAARLATLRNYDSSVHTIATPDDTYLVRNETLATASGTWHVITARSQETFTLLLDQLTVALWIAVVILVMGFGGASWLLTAAALRPVTRMRKHAEELSARGSAEPLVVGVARDELSALAVTLNEFILQLRAASERERQMVSDASHELRTPIAVLKTQLELAHLATGDAVALEAEIAAAERSVQRLAGLANGLLELSQAQSEASDAPSTISDLADELARSVDHARLLAAARDITVDFDLDDAVDAGRFAISAGNFGRLVSNLTDNAIKALPGSGWVRLDLRRAGTALTLTVSDNGPGMPPGFIPIAFDRFSRPDESRNVNDGGSGLGLAIVHAIVVGAQGTVRLENRGSGGLRVTVTVPEIR